MSKPAGSEKRPAAASTTTAAKRQSPRAKRSLNLTLRALAVVGAQHVLDVIRRHALRPRVRSRTRQRAHSLRPIGGTLFGICLGRRAGNQRIERFVIGAEL